jgi:hypothetical protein
LEFKVSNNNDAKTGETRWAWEERFVDGAKYYYNSLTGESRRELPVKPSNALFE